MAHMLPAQVAVPWVVSHSLLHAPQCTVSVASVTSHPLVATPSQSAKPSAQAMPHTPPAQVAVPWVALHASLHEPQWAASVARSVSQPSSRLSALQSTQPSSHAPLHAPAVHERIGTWLLEQAPAQTPSQTPPVQVPEVQSTSAAQPAPLRHVWVHSVPPQSTSVSRPLATPSSQVGGRHLWLVRSQTRLGQSSGTLQSTVV